MLIMIVTERSSGCSYVGRWRGHVNEQEIYRIALAGSLTLVRDNFRK